MKKLFIVLAVASLGFVACNNDGESKTTPVDSAALKATADSLEAEAAKAKAAADTLNNKADSLGAKADSLAKKAN